MPSRPDFLIPSREYAARLHAKLQALGDLPMWTVYSPFTAGHAGLWRARLFRTLPKAVPTRFVIIEDRLAVLHEMLPLGVYRLERQADDLPEIVEVWL